MSRPKGRREHLESATKARDRMGAVYQALAQGPALTEPAIVAATGLTPLMVRDALLRLSERGTVERCTLMGGTEAADVEAWRWARRMG